MEKPKNPFADAMETPSQANKMITIYLWFACGAPGLYFVKVFNQTDFSWSSLSPMELSTGLSGFLAILGYLCFRKFKKALYAYLCAGAFLAFTISRHFSLPQNHGEILSKQILAVLLFLFALWITRSFILAARMISRNQ